MAIKIDASAAAISILALLLALASPAGIWAEAADVEESEAMDEAEEALEARVAAELSSAVAAQSSGSGRSGALDKLQIHGFLTQAYAEALLADVPVLPGHHVARSSG